MGIGTKEEWHNAQIFRKFKPTKKFRHSVTFSVKSCLKAYRKNDRMPKVPKSSNLPRNLGIHKDLFESLHEKWQNAQISNLPRNLAFYHFSHKVLLETLRKKCQNVQISQKFILTKKFGHSVTFLQLIGKFYFIGKMTNSITRPIFFLQF